MEKIYPKSLSNKYWPTCGEIVNCWNGSWRVVSSYQTCASVPFSLHRVPTHKPPTRKSSEPQKLRGTKSFEAFSKIPMHVWLKPRNPLTPMSSRTMTTSFFFLCTLTLIALTQSVPFIVLHGNFLSLLLFSHFFWVVWIFIRFLGFCWCFICYSWPSMLFSVSSSLFCFRRINH